MKNREFRARLKDCESFQDLWSLWADIDAAENCEGTPQECFCAGMVNAMDMRDAGREENTELYRIALAELENMHPEFL